MILKPLTSIGKEDLQRLVDNQVPEGRTLEYKREAPGNSDADKIKFLRAVSGFANTDGGDLIYGVNEDDGIPIAISGIPMGTVDQKNFALSSYSRPTSNRAFHPSISNPSSSMPRTVP